MSTRTQLYSIPTMDPIVESVGSGDEKLLAVVDEYNVQYAKEMLSKIAARRRARGFQLRRQRP